MKFDVYIFAAFVWLFLGNIVLFVTDNLPISMFFFGCAVIWQLAGAVVYDLKGKFK